MARDFPLHPTEAEISTAVLGPNRTNEWKALAQVLERDGLPRIDPVIGRRYFPAVKQYFDRRNRVSIGAPNSGEAQEKTIWIRPRRDSNGESGRTAAAPRTGLRVKS